MIGKTILVLALVLGLAHGANQIQLLGKLRDFANSGKGDPKAHPDFDAYSGSEAGIVKEDLGVDGKPVFAKANANTVTSAESFSVWYNDDPKWNIPFDYTITLTDNGNGVYTYDNGAFFPLDGQGFGNDDYNHNFGFTYEIHTVFTFVKGQEFYFRGDDDLWVFINKKLVIDLGGVHGALEANVKLNDLGLTEGEDYTLDIFFAERHYSASSFKIQTSIQLKPSCAPPQIYNPTNNKCVDCVKPDVYILADNACGQCTGTKVYNEKTFACEECPAPTVFDSGKKTCVPCPEKTLYLAGSKSCGTCPGPKVYDPSTYICDYCPSPEFYNYDGTCVHDCPKAQQNTQGKVPICNYPCRITQIYQPATGKCRCDCPKPYTKFDMNGYQVCDIIEAS